MVIVRRGLFDELTLNGEVYSGVDLLTAGCFRENGLVKLTAKVGR